MNLIAFFTLVSAISAFSLRPKSNATNTKPTAVNHTQIEKTPKKREARDYAEKFTRKMVKPKIPFAYPPYNNFKSAENVETGVDRDPFSNFYVVKRKIQQFPKNTEFIDYNRSPYEFTNVYDLGFDGNYRMKIGWVLGIVEIYLLSIQKEVFLFRNCETLTIIL